MRRPDWPEQLAAHMEQARKTPFCWGKHDCCLFAADAALAMTGTDFGAVFRGHYATKAGAFRALKKYGATTIPDTATALLGEPILPALAQRGDVVYAQTLRGPAMGICAGASACFAAPEGLTHLPLSDCALAWRIA